MILRLCSEQDHKRLGFTLIELVVVLAVVSIVTTIGMINLSRLQKIFKLRSAADEITAQIQYGRELAVANKNGAVYDVNLSGSVVKLSADGAEFSRYQIPQGVSVNPISFDWNFTPITGLLSTCSPCRITLSAGDVLEIINIQANGLVN